MSPKLT